MSKSMITHTTMQLIDAFVIVLEKLALSSSKSIESTLVCL